MINYIIQYIDRRNEDSDIKYFKGVNGFKIEFTTSKKEARQYISKEMATFAHNRIFGKRNKYTTIEEYESD